MVKKCGKCGREIQDDRNYETHVARCVFNITKTLSCDRCQKKYSYRSSLYLHKKTCTGETINRGVHKRSRSIRRHREPTPYVQEATKANTALDTPPRVSNYNPHYRYKLCLRTKTCTYEPVPKDDDAVAEDNECTDQFKIEDEKAEEIYEEYIIDHEYFRETNVKLEEDDDDSIPYKTTDDEEGVVVIEDFGFFNKVEVRQRNECEIDEFQENEEYII